MKKTTLIVFALCVYSVCTAQVLNLNGILDSIEAKNPLLLSYQNKINADNALVASANTWQAPRAGVELDNNQYSFENFYDGMVRLSFMQDFPNRKQINAETNYLQSLSQIDINEYAHQRNKLFSLAKEAYYGIYIMQKDTAILNQNMQTLQAMIQLTQTLI
ncbi:MAG TPA: TolC family protein, partial [Bacteroidia bacterium]|nr:TolC family protein [Bacteroidia bacterium]